jgi:putative tributyrin esterase
MMNSKSATLFFRSLPLLFAMVLSLSSQLKSQERIVISSKNLKCDDTVLVFSPAKANKKLNKSKDLKATYSTPTLFLLHGWSGCYKDWSAHYDLQEISNRTGFRIICPDGFYNSWYLNNIDTTKMQWRTFFDKELYPMMKERYAFDPHRTFITGLSMGGHGAINIFIDDTSRFRTAGSMSGVLDLPSTSLRKSQMSKVIGDEERLCNSSSACVRVLNIKGLTVPMIISCGYNDIYSANSEKFSQICRKNMIPHLLLLSPGKHSWQYWGFALEQHIKLFSAILNGENLGY